MGHTLLRPPPRAVPWSVQFLILFSPQRTLMGGATCIFSLMLVFGFQGKLFPTQFKDPFAGPVQQLRGRVTEVTEDPDLKGRVAVSFEVKAGERPERGISYTLDKPPAAGDEVPIERALTPAAPMRIVGMSTYSSGLSHTAEVAVLLTLLLLPLLIGACIVAFGAWRFRRLPHLLRHGEVAQASLLKRKDETRKGSEGDTYTMTTLTFGFVDGKGKQRRVTARTTMPRQLVDEPTETVLYDPSSSSAVLFDDLPRQPVLDNLGDILPASFGQMKLPLLMLLPFVLVPIGIWVRYC